jgi:hypothetical protein
MSRIEAIRDGQGVKAVLLGQCLELLALGAGDVDPAEGRFRGLDDDLLHAA